MRLRAWAPAVVMGVLLLAASTFSAGAFDKPEYAARRSRLMAQIGDGAAVFLGAQTPSNDLAFRQGHDFFYMTGVELPDAVLVVDGMRKESVLFFTTTEAAADGAAIPLDLVRTPVEYSGIERALPAEQFSSFITGLVNRSRPVYTVFKPEELGRENSNEKFNALQKSTTLNMWDGRLTRELQFVRLLRERFPQADVRDSTAIVWNLRKFKSPAELALMRETARIGVKGHRALIQSTRPGIAERSLAAVFDFVVKTEGAQDLAYDTIIMSAKNHAYGHYHMYDRVLNAGDFVILDAAPDYRNYHVDISTTFPASGTFSPRQRELYEAALAVSNVAIESYRPGITLRDVGQNVDALLKARGWDRYAQDFRGIVRLVFTRISHIPRVSPVRLEVSDWKLNTMGGRVQPLGLKSHPTFLPTNSQVSPVDRSGLLTVSSNAGARSARRPRRRSRGCRR